jgi:hypothetical protein
MLVFKANATLRIRFFEPGGREFESLRARFSIRKLLNINVPTVAKTQRFFCYVSHAQRLHEVASSKLAIDSQIE